jgi:hypothetical protein
VCVVKKCMGAVCLETAGAPPGASEIVQGGTGIQRSRHRAETKRRCDAADDKQGRHVWCCVCAVQLVA